MKILLALNSFKGSCTAIDACHNLGIGLQSANDKNTIYILPLADGGDGTLDVLEYFGAGKRVHVDTIDALGRPIQAAYLWDKANKIAFIELAAASGIARLSSAEKNILKANTLGTGILIKHALKKNIKKIILTVGGSATNDAGWGIAHALGVVCLDQKGKVLFPDPSAFKLIGSIQDKRTTKAKKIIYELWTDVVNPFYGVNGAVAVYGPQKGADEKAMQLLEAGMIHFNDLFIKKYKTDLQKIRGSGAAGGTAGGLHAILKAKIKSGSHELFKASRLINVLKKSDLVITGEGAIDSQSTSGKLVGEILNLAKRNNKKIIAVCGKSGFTERQARKIGFEKIYSLTNEKVNEKKAKKNVLALLIKLGNQIGEEWGHSIRN